MRVRFPVWPLPALPLRAPAPSGPPPTRDAAIAHIGEAQDVVATLKNGAEANLFIRAIRRCGVRTEGLRTQDRHRVDPHHRPFAEPGPTARSPIAALPVVLPIVAAASLGCAAVDCKQRKADHVAAGGAPTHVSRGWVDEFEWAAPLRPYPCFTAPGAPSSPAFKTEDRALDWVWTH